MLFLPAIAQAETTIVSFTFDDAPKSVVTVGLPILAEAGYPATVYISTRNTTFHGYMNWDDVALVARNGWEIGAHTYTHARLTKLTDAEIVQEFEASNADYVRHGYHPISFATPFGSYDDRALNIVKRYYESHRAAWPAGVNTLTPNPYEIASYEVSRATTIEEVTSLLEDLQKNPKGGWIVLQLHHLFQGGETVTEEYGTDLLEAIVAQVKSRGIAVLTVSDALKKINQE